ncbi:asparagine synthase (glutamine-hydrolyzing) [Candidatus Parcubacteria bacterium]|nr:MAG: asparagine synthase (glutamine-hydrolyzing) [Candidatus Parcubacteria bacterium]
MCGICGKLSWTSRSGREIVERMNLRLAHRGPDAAAVEQVGPIVLGHRRLAIIDLTSAGNQPMMDVSGQYWIVFNGEVYNFLEIRDELLKSGAQFRSRSDTEVILEAYKQWGIHCLQHFNGMFAFALWDGIRQQLFLVRDRLGKKPLFYYEFPDGGISFASEIKALLQDPEIPRKLNLAALSQYLSLSYILTSESIIQGVSKLPPAHYLRVEKGKTPEIVRYWNLEQSFRNKRDFQSEEAAAEELKALLDDAVGLRLISDVPLGAFLSGGVDSSAIVASMCQQKEPGDVYSFSMGFEEQSYSELHEARAVAAALGVTHKDMIAYPNAVDLLPRIVYFADEPFADTSMIPMFLLAEFSRKHVTVCLSGDGGDEIFAGYETYFADQIYQAVHWIPASMVRALYFAFDRIWPVTYKKVSFDYKMRKFLTGLGYPYERAHYHWRTIFTDEEKRTLVSRRLNGVLDVDPFNDFMMFAREVEGCHYLDRSMYVDIKTWLVDDILVKVDRATMAHALEARAPFLDYRVVEFAASLPVKLKMNLLRKKYLLKKSQRGRLPAFVLKRSKQGFNAPIAHWLLHELRLKYYDLLLSDAAEMGLEPSFIAKLWDEHIQKVQDNSFKLLTLINLVLWIREFDVNVG